MTEEKKHSLRTRRPIRPNNMEEQDPSHYNYSRQGYSHGSSQLTAQAQITLTAKQLVKFCNAANRKYRESVHPRPETLDKPNGKTIEPEPRPDPTKWFPKGFKRVENHTEPPSSLKKHPQPQIEHTKSLNEPAFNRNIKSQPVRGDGKTKSVLDINRMKGLQRQLAAKMERLQRRSVAMKMEQSGVLYNRMGPTARYHYNRTSNDAFALTPSMPMPHVLEESTRMMQGQPAAGKLFKRASYHIAIAYYIHVKKCGEKGLIGHDIDPTLFARKLKQSSGIFAYASK